MHNASFRAALVAAAAVASLAVAAATAVPADNVLFDTTWAVSGGHFPSNEACPNGTYTVPAGVNRLRITAVGGVGMGGTDAEIDPSGKAGFLGHNGGGDGGQAASVSGIVPVIPGTVLNVVVATDGAAPRSTTAITLPPAGGWGGGGKAANVDAPVSGGGGGASYVTTSNVIDVTAAGAGDKTDIDDPNATGCKPPADWANPDYDDSSHLLIVAAGGGGGGNAANFGNGGRGGNAGLLGASGESGSSGPASGGGGGGAGGTQSGGGGAGTLGADSSVCTMNRSGGHFLMGGWNDSSVSANAGGGGSGLWGGGSGAKSCISAGNGGGGGGSSFIAPGALYTSSALDDSARPYVSVTPLHNTTTTALAASANPAYTGQAMTFTVTVTPEQVEPEAGAGGTVTLFENTPCAICEGGYLLSTVGGGTVTNGVGTISKTWTSVQGGAHLISALYQGDGLYQGSISSRVSFSVQAPPAAPTITGNPSNQSVNYGDNCSFSGGVIVGCNPNVHFSASASGNPAPTVQWQVKAPSGSFTDIASATSAQLDFFGQVGQSGNSYRAVFTNGGGSVATTPSTLTVARAALTIRANDKGMVFHGTVPTLDATYGQGGAVLRNGDTAGVLNGTLHCTTTGTSSSSNGTYPIDCSSSTFAPANYTITYTAGTLTIQEPVQSITLSPSAPAHAHVGDTYAPVVTGGGSGNPVVLSIDATSDAGVCSVTAGVVSFYSAGDDGIGNCFIDANQAGGNGFPAAQQNQQWVVVLNVAPSIVTHPQSLSVQSGDPVTFTGSATGTGLMSCWLVLVPGQNWAVVADSCDFSGALTATLSFTANAGENGYQYRVVFQNLLGTQIDKYAESSAATLTVGEAPAITVNPGWPTTQPGSTVTYAAGATGTPKPSLEWQVSTDGGQTFSAIPGAPTTTSPAGITNYSFVAAASMNGNKYRAKFSNAHGTAYTDVTTLGVLFAPGVVTHPTDQTVGVGGTASFSAVPSGNPTPDVQWQVQVAGASTFVDIPDAKTAQLVLTGVTRDLDGNRYRADFSSVSLTRPNARDHAITNSALLTVTAGSQAIVFTSSPPLASVGGSAYTPTATGGGSGNPVTFSTEGSACSYSSGKVSFDHPGTCIVDADQDGDDVDYEAAAEVQQVFTVGKGAQSITFASTAPSAVVGSSTYTPTATGGASSKPVVFSTEGLACSFSGGGVHFDHAGTCVIDADQAGNDDYLPATQAQQTFTVGKGSQTIQFTSSPPSAVVGSAVYTPTATGGASGRGVRFTTEGTACSLTDTGVKFDHAGSCVIDAQQSGSVDYLPAALVQQIFTVGRASQTVLFTTTAPTGVVVGTPFYVPSASGTASGNLVVIGIDATTTNSACLLFGLSVIFNHAGTCVVDADQAGSGDYLAAPRVQQTIVVGRASQSVQFTTSPPASPAVGDPGYAPVATGGLSGNPVSFGIDATTTNSACSLGAGVVRFDHAGTCVVDADQAGSEDYFAAPRVQQTIVVGRASQSVQFTTSPPASPAVGDPGYAPVATGGLSGNPVSFGIDAATTNAACSLSAGVVRFDHAGTCVVDANQAGNADYFAAPQAQQSFTVGKASQAVTFGSPAPGAAAVAGPGYTPTASGGASGKSVVFSTDPATTNSACSTAGGIVTFQHPGTCVVDANQAGNADYFAAPQVQQSFAVDKGAQSIGFATLPLGTVGTSVTLVATGGGSASPIVFSIDPSSGPGVCKISGTTLTYLAVGTCVVAANKAGDANYYAAPTVKRTNLAKLGQTIKWDQPLPEKQVTQDVPELDAKASSGLLVTFSSLTPQVCSIGGKKGRTVTLVAPGTCTIAADQVGDGTWGPAPTVARSFTVTKADQKIDFPQPPSPKTAASFDVTATAGSLLTVAFTTTTPLVCTAGGTNGATITIVGRGRCTIVANQNGNDFYNAAKPVSQSIQL